jgi:hypothetical protein
VQSTHEVSLELTTKKSVEIEEKMAKIQQQYEQLTNKTNEEAQEIEKQKQQLEKEQEQVNKMVQDLATREKELQQRAGELDVRVKDWQERISTITATHQIGVTTPTELLNLVSEASDQVGKYEKEWKALQIKADDAFHKYIESQKSMKERSLSRSLSPPPLLSHFLPFSPLSFLILLSSLISYSSPPSLISYPSLSSPRVDSLENWLTLMEHQVPLPEAQCFSDLLHAIQHVNPAVTKKRCFISYAWNVDKKENTKLQAKLVQIKSDLVKAGVEVMLDIQNMEGDINLYMSGGIQQCDRVLLVSQSFFFVLVFWFFGLVFFGLVFLVWFFFGLVFFGLVFLV